MSAADVLAADGPLADVLPGFAPRDVQQVLSAAVEKALAQGTTLIAEAGTGVGKSMAYLVPVMRSGRRTVISTATRHLQDQLFQRDVPLPSLTTVPETSSPGMSEAPGGGGYIPVRCITSGRFTPAALT